MKFRAPIGLLILLVIVGLGCTFWQLYGLPLESDLAVIVLPAPACRQVLGDPFGWAALTRHEVYVAPNRFFAHAAMVVYFKSVPFLLQSVFPPITSIYVACALFGTLVETLLLYLLAGYAGGQWDLRRRRIWVLMLLLLPLFQLGGYNDQLGIIDHSVTYTFFYAFPLALLLLWLKPFYQAAVEKRPFRVGPLGLLGMLGLTVVLSFNGAIVPGVVAVLSAGIGLYWLGQQAPLLRRGEWAAVWRRIPWQPFGLLICFGLLCLYSLYIGRFEAENAVLPLGERYTRLSMGAWRLLRKPGLPLLVGAVVLNGWLLRRAVPAMPNRLQLLHAGRWLGVFALVFVLLLPLGGYREYRPYIIRHDSILPVSLGLLYFYALTSYYLARHLAERPRRWFLGWVGAVSVFFQVTDLALPPANNACERQALQQLAASKKPVTQLCDKCSVLDWTPITRPEQSQVQAQLLAYWGVTHGVRLYYQAPKPALSSR